MVSTTVKLNSSIGVHRSGVAAVEFAIIAPVLLFFALAIIEITGAIYLQQSLTVAAYEGARVALLPNTDSQNVVTASNRILQSRKILGANVSVFPKNFNSGDFGDPIRVEVVAPIVQNAFLNQLFPAQQSLTASVTMMKER